MATVVVNPAGMVHRALAQRDVGDEIASEVDLEEVPDALSDIPIVVFSKSRSGKNLSSRKWLVIPPNGT